VVGWLVIQLVTQEKGTRNMRIKENEQLHMIVEHVWDSPGVSAFCPVRKLKVYGHIILLIKPLLLLLLLLLMCTCTCWRTSLILNITENDFHRNVIFRQDDALPVLFICTVFLVSRIISRWEKLVHFCRFLFHQTAQ
jgi:hypothetical protein